MKKNIITLNIIVALGLGLASSASAETHLNASASVRTKLPPIEKRIERIASTTEKRMERNEDRKDRIASTSERRVIKIENIKDRVASTTEKRKERVEKRIDRKETRITGQFEAFLTGLENASAKLTTVLQRLSLGGKDVTDANAKLVIANNKIATAQISVKAFDDLSLSLGTSTASTTKLFVQEFRAKRAAARTDLENAKKSLGDALKATRKIELGATSTTSVNASSSTQ